MNSESKLSSGRKPLPKAPTFDELKDFTLESYVKLLQYLNKIYNIVPFCGIPREDIPYLILRHDIDKSLPAALKMAQIERDLGIKSTYFVLFSSEFYNPLEGNNISILKQISKLGHEIGLHYDVSRYSSYGQDMKQTLKIEIQLLEHLLGRKVYSIARHGLWDRDPFATIKKYINANDPRLRGHILVHEGCRAWSLQGLLRLLNDPPPRAQLLTHPENWQEDRINRETLLERFFQNLEKKNLALKKRTRRIWLTDPIVSEHDALVKEGDFTRFHLQERRSNSIRQSKLWQGLNYYNTVFRYYMINTSFGWYIHRLRTKIHDKLYS